MSGFYLGQAVAAPYQQPRFTTYSVEDGLSQVTVYDITQDAEGFMWLATQTGIDRFDGYSFVHFGKWQDDPSDGLLGVNTFQLEMDADGESLWIGTFVGLSRFYFKTRTFEHYTLIDDSGKDQPIVKRIRVDKQKRVWVVTDYGLFRYNRDSNQMVSQMTSDSATGSLSDITVVDDNTALVATANGVFALTIDSNTVMPFTLHGMGISVLAQQSPGWLWIGTKADGLYQYEYQAGQWQPVHHYQQENGLADPVISDILVRRNNQVWLATPNGISIIPDPQNYEVKTPSVKDTGLADESTSTLYENSAGLVWVGSASSGFSVYDPESVKFNTFKVSDSYDTSSVRIADKNRLWVSNESGLWRYNYVTGETEGPWLLQGQNGNSVKSNRMLSIAVDRNTGVLWIATRLGVGSINPGEKAITIRTVKNKPIYTISIDREGDIWIGSYNDGVYVYRPDEDRILQHWPMSLSAKIYPDSRSTAWVANITGLYHLNKYDGELTRFTTSTPGDTHISHNVVTWISPASEPGYYWVGTQAGGLNRMHIDSEQPLKASFEEIAKDSRLSNLSIGAVLEDENRNLWITTTEGITKYSLVTQQLEYFDSRNGSTDTGYYIASAEKTDDGYMFFGGKEGLTAFLPRNITQSEWQPPVYFTEVDVLHSSVQEEGQSISNIGVNDFQNPVIRLTPGDLSFTAEFAALDFSSPDSIQYAYRLLGFDPGWRTVDASRRSATYTNLDPGQYVLEVRATNKDGVWSPNQAKLNVIIIPPWWQQWWALWLFVITALSVLFFGYRWRVATLKRRSDDLAKLVEEKTQDLEQAIAKLTVLSSQDPLTQLSNRRDFSTRAMVEWQRFQRYERPFAIVLVDVDYFKTFNDTYGHSAGDLVLVEIAQALGRMTRDSDIVARWGGEEFIILLTEQDLAEASIVAEKMRHTIQHLAIQHGDMSLAVTITLGIAQIQHGETLEGCIHRADVNLYQGKEKGRNCLVAS